MKIAYVNGLYSPDIGGGAEITLKSIVEGMQRRGHEVFVITTTDKVGGRIDYVDGVKVYRIGIENIYWPHKNKGNGFSRLRWHLRDRYNREMARHVRDIIDKEKPDVASCHNLAGLSVSVWDAFVENKVPTVQVLHDLYLMCYRSTMFKKGKSCSYQCVSCGLMRGSHRALSSTLSAAVGVSQYVITRLASNGYFDNIPKKVINNSRSIPDPGMRTRRHGELVFGYIGTIMLAKGIEWLLDSFLELRSGHKYLLRVAGKGEPSYVEYLKKKYRDARIEFCGYVSSSDFYRTIDVCVVPSIWPDTFPGVAFEALANHVPVVCSNMGGLPEIVKTGINGIVCDVQDRDSLRAAMQDLLSQNDLFGMLQSHSRSSVASLVDMERMLGAYESLYCEISGSLSNESKV